MAGSKPTLIVDGYNVIHARADGARRPVGDLESERDWRIGAVADYSGYRGVSAVVVFDAYNRKDLENRETTVSGVRVVFTKFGETADTYIEALVYAIMGSHPEVRRSRRGRRVEVVSSDSAVQQLVLGGGATRMSAREWLIDVKRVKKRAAHLKQEKAPAQHNRLSETVNADVHATLDAMRKSDVAPVEKK